MWDTALVLFCGQVLTGQRDPSTSCLSWLRGMSWSRARGCVSQVDRRVARTERRRMFITLLCTRPSGSDRTDGLALRLGLAVAEVAQSGYRQEAAPSPLSGPGDEEGVWLCGSSLRNAASFRDRLGVASACVTKITYFRQSRRGQGVQMAAFAATQGSWIVSPGESMGMPQRE